jgi:hypothetical protein
MKSQWKAVEPTRCEAQYYSNNADERGEYRTCRIDVVVVANKAERERTAEMDGDCCCSLTRRADFDFRRLEKRSGIRAGWTPSFERLGSGCRISIFPSVLCVLTNTTTSPIVCLLLVSPSCRSNAQVVCMATAVQDLPGDGASKVAVKAFAATALSSLVSRWRSSLHDGGDESGDGSSRSSFSHSSRRTHLPTTGCLFPSTLLNKVGFP